VKLKIRDVEFEGTPEELAQAGLETLIGNSSATGPTASAPASGNGHAVSGFSPEIGTFLAMRVPPETRSAVEAIITEVTGWEGVRVAVGSGIPGGRYLRFHRRNASVGAFLYLNPKKAVVRVPGDAADGMTYAYARDVVETNPHQVTVPLEEPGAIDEALALIRRAYEEAR
jgi:hypothetical protein